MEMPSVKTAVIISANAEWNALRDILVAPEVHRSPFGEWFLASISHYDTPVLFFHGGWGKIAAAASAQYLIDHATPELLVNLGTCGGFQGDIHQGSIVLVERAVVYDIIEMMGDHDAAIAHYTTDIDLSWIAEIPDDVTRTVMVSGDRDLIADEIGALKSRYGAVAGDWESGAIAYVAARNGIRLLILRGVSDLVGADGGEAYGAIEIFHSRTGPIMERLIGMLPEWLRHGLKE